MYNRPYESSVITGHISSTSGCYGCFEHNRVGAPALILRYARISESVNKFVILRDQRTSSDSFEQFVSAWKAFW